MLLFKSRKVPFNNLVGALLKSSKETPHNHYGFMLKTLDNKGGATLLFQRNLKSLDLLLDKLYKAYNVDSEADLDRMDIAIIDSKPDKGDRRKGTPMIVSNDMKKAPLQTENKDRHWSFVKCNTVAMVDIFQTARRDSGNGNFSIEQNFICDVLGNLLVKKSVKDLMFMDSKFRIFKDKHIIILDKKDGWTFFGRFSCANDKIRTSDRLVVSI